MDLQTKLSKFYKMVLVEAEHKNTNEFTFLRLIYDNILNINLQKRHKTILLTLFKNNIPLYKTMSKHLIFITF